jgi:hypothetical protein
LSNIALDRAQEEEDALNHNVIDLDYKMNDQDDIRKTMQKTDGTFYNHRKNLDKMGAPPSFLEVQNMIIASE